MRKLLILVVLLTIGLGVSAVRAQSLQDALQQFLGGSQSTQTSQQATQKPVYPTVREFVDITWKYAAPHVEYRGSDPLASLAITSFKDQIAALYAKAGLVPGRDALVFYGKNRFAGNFAKQKVEGTYKYAPATGIAEMTVVQEGKKVVIRGYLTRSDGVLTLLFDAADASKVALSVSPQLAENPDFVTLNTLLQSYPGIMLGAEFKR